MPLAFHFLYLLEAGFHEIQWQGTCYFNHRELPHYALN